MIDIRNALALASAETGWDQRSKLEIMLQFVEWLQEEDDRLMGEKFQRFLDDKAGEEVDGMERDWQSESNESAPGVGDEGAS